MPDQDKQSDDLSINEETAVLLPERDAMSIIDGGGKLFPVAGFVPPGPQNPPDPDPVKIDPPPPTE
jgi:hypothetical protein